MISDPETTTSAAAMDVHVGSLADPEEYQGLAHFLEHMLFMVLEMSVCLCLPFALASHL